MTHPVVVMWTTPRSRSTAFERMMIERGDVEVVDEPYSARYYFSSERRSHRFDEREPDATATAVTGALLRAATDRPVFVKDMAYHLAGADLTAVVERFHHSFLVREPDATLASLARKWPDFTAEEAGYEALGRLYDLVVDRRGPPPVLDADDLVADPAGHVAAWCEAVGLPFRPDALRWEPGMVPQWTRWQDWYTGVATSTGFAVPTATGDRAPRPLTGPVAAAARTTYDRLRRSRLRAGGGVTPTCPD